MGIDAVWVWLVRFIDNLCHYRESGGKQNLAREELTRYPLFSISELKGIVQPPRDENDEF